MQCSSQVFECRAFSTAAAKSQSQKLTLLPPIPQTLFLLQSRSAPKSVSVYGSPILLVMGAPRSFAACPPQPPREVTLRQQQPVISGVLDQASACFHQPLLQARERPVLDSLRQHQPPPQVPQVVGQHAQPESYLIGPEMMAAQPRHLHRLLAFFDPLLRRASLVVETDHSPAVRPQVGHDESDSGEQLPKVELHLRHHPTRRLPTRRLVEKALVPDHGFMTGPSYRPRQQLVDVPLQIAVGRDADGVLRAPLLQRFVDLRLGEGRVGPKHHLFAQLLLPLNLGKQQLFPAVGAVHFAGPQLRSKTVALAAEQQQWVIASGLEVDSKWPL